MAGPTVSQICCSCSLSAKWNLCHFLFLNCSPLNFPPTKHLELQMSVMWKIKLLQEMLDWKFVGQVFIASVLLIFGLWVTSKPLSPCQEHKLDITHFPLPVYERVLTLSFQCIFCGFYSWHATDLHIENYLHLCACIYYVPSCFAGFIGGYLALMGLAQRPDVFKVSTETEDGDFAPVFIDLCVLILE